MHPALSVDPPIGFGSAADVHVPLAHHHLLAVFLSELPPGARDIAILDVGCGDGRLIAFLLEALKTQRPSLEPRLYGFDVTDSRVQAVGFFDTTRARLLRDAPSVDWDSRLRLIPSGERWPYDDASFDWVFSNQVLEHVRDHAFVFSEVERVLKPGGRSVHLFPVRENVLEGHMHIPCAHWFRDHDRVRKYIRTMTALGFGIYRRERPHHLSPAEFAEAQADFLQYFTNYIGKGDVLRLAKHAGLRCSFRYTEHFYWNKARALLGLPLAHRYARVEPPLVHGLMVALLSRVSCVTAYLEKKQTYGGPSALAGATQNS